MRKKKPRAWFSLLRTSLSLEERKRFSAMAQEEGMWMSELVTQLIRGYMQQQQEGGDKLTK